MWKELKSYMIYSRMQNIVKKKKELYMIYSTQKIIRKKQTPKMCTLFGDIDSEQQNQEEKKVKVNEAYINFDLVWLEKKVAKTIIKHIYRVLLMRFDYCF